jgi:large subunit ribosomal protein L11
VPIPVKLTAFKDKTFEWEMTSPPATFFIKKAAGISEGSSKPGHGAKVGLYKLKSVDPKLESAVVSTTG